jgi:hypothetical protein
MTRRDEHQGPDELTDLEFEQRLDEWRSGGAELTDAEAARYLAQMDPDWERVERYLRNELSPADEAAFDIRLATDPAFREKMWPSLEIDRAVQVLDTPAKATRRYPKLATVFAWISAVVWVYAAVRMGSCVAADRRGAQELDAGVAWTGDMRFFKVVTTGPAETTTMPLKPATVSLRPASRLAWQTTRMNTLVGALDGSALFAIVSDTVRVRTTVAQIQATKGYFDVTSAPGAGETLVRVYDGYVDVAPVGSILGTRVTALHSIRLSRDRPMAADTIDPASIPPLNLHNRIRGYKK